MAYLRWVDSTRTSITHPHTWQKSGLDIKQWEHYCTLSSILYAGTQTRTYVHYFGKSQFHMYNKPRNNGQMEANGERVTVRYIHMVSLDGSVTPVLQTGWYR